MPVGEVGAFFPLAQAVCAYYGSFMINGASCVSGLRPSSLFQDPEALPFQSLLTPIQPIPKPPLIPSIYLVIEMTAKYSLRSVSLRTTLAAYEG